VVISIFYFPVPVECQFRFPDIPFVNTVIIHWDVSMDEPYNRCL